MSLIVVLAEVGADWPETFGPYPTLEDAHRDADRLAGRFLSTEVQQLLAPEDIDRYLAHQGDEEQTSPP